MLNRIAIRVAIAGATLFSFASFSQHASAACQGYSPSCAEIQSITQAAVKASKHIAPPARCQGFTPFCTESEQVDAAVAKVSKHEVPPAPCQGFVFACREKEAIKQATLKAAVLARANNASSAPQTSTP